MRPPGASRPTWNTFEGPAPPKGRNIVSRKKVQLGGSKSASITFWLVDQSSPIFSSNRGWNVVDQVLFRFSTCRCVPEIFAIKVESCQKSPGLSDIFASQKIAVDRHLLEARRGGMKRAHASTPRVKRESSILVVLLWAGEKGQCHSLKQISKGCQRTRGNNTPTLTLPVNCILPIEHCLLQCHTLTSVPPPSDVISRSSWQNVTRKRGTHWRQQICIHCGGRTTSFML